MHPSCKRKHPPTAQISTHKRRRSKLPVSLKRKAGILGDEVNSPKKTRLLGLSKPPIGFQKPDIPKRSNEEMILPGGNAVIRSDARRESLKHLAASPKGGRLIHSQIVSEESVFDTDGFNYVDAFDMYASSLCGDESDCDKVPPIGPRVNSWNIRMSKSTRYPHCWTSAVDSGCETCGNKSCWCKEEALGTVGAKCVVRG